MLKNTIMTPCADNPSYDDYVSNNYDTVGCGTSVA
jgi:hypothetical protein